MPDPVIQTSSPIPANALPHTLPHERTYRYTNTRDLLLLKPGTLHGTRTATERTILLEVNRMLNHLLNIGCHAGDLGVLL